MTLEGKRVRLRAIKKEDCEKLFQWYSDPAVSLFAGIFFPQTYEGIQRWFENSERAKNPQYVAYSMEAMLPNSYVLIGLCNLFDIDWRDRQASIGIMIGETSYWQKGYGQEAVELLTSYAFSQLNLHRVQTSIMSYNDRSLKLFRKLYLEEGKRAESRFANGKYWDEHLFGVLRKNWPPNAS